VTTATAALHLACLAAGLGPGDIGITSPITFVASANAIAYCGGVPAFADVDPATVTLDPEALKAAGRRRRPKLIVPVDFAGQPADLPAIHEIARRQGAIVIEDAAHALGASYTHVGREHRVGECAHAEMAIFSFHPVKHIATGEGGAITTNDPGLFKRLSELRNHGITKDVDRMTRNDGPWYYEQHDLGFNYRITDFQCALGLSQLRKLDAFVARRRQLVRSYRERLADLGGEVSLLTEIPGRHCSYHLLVARLRAGGERRLRVVERLHAAGVRVQVHYIPVHLQPWYRRRFDFREGDFPQAESYYSGCISLPLFPRMTEGDVDRVCGALRAALAKSR
jgi:dTDP-4-amino-4,6-dideoxygalactose transaminase